MTHRFWQIWINILINQSKRQTRSKTPPSVQNIDAPEYSGSKSSSIKVFEVIEQTAFAMETHFEAFAGCDADSAPGEKFFACVKVVYAL